VSLVYLVGIEGVDMHPNHLGPNHHFNRLNRNRGVPVLLHNGPIATALTVAPKWLPCLFEWEHIRP